MPFLTHNELRLSRQPIRIARLPQAFEGLRLVQISDLHFYEYTDLAYYNRVAEQVNALQPDLLMLTGDVVHYGSDYLSLAASFLDRLQVATGAKFAILGNHDYNDGGLGQHVMDRLGTSGFQVLKNTNACLTRGESRLWVAGLDDLWYGQPNLEQALQGIPTEHEVTLMLAHNPLLFDPVALAGVGRVDLVLAGHTHAGHVYIPVLGPIYRRVFRMKYRYGLYEKQGCQLYVSSGVGSAAFYLKKRKIGFPRFRFNTHPEIVLLTLMAGR